MKNCKFQKNLFANLRLSHIHIYRMNSKRTHSFVWNGYMWMVEQKRASNGECRRSHLVAFPRMSVTERTLKDVCSAPMTVWQFVCLHSPCADARQFLTNPFGKHTKFADECSFGVFYVYVYAALLNDYGLIIPIKTNKDAYACVCFIFKIEDATNTRIYFPILVHTLKWESRFTCMYSAFNFEDKAYAHISFFVHLNRYYQSTVI